MRKTLLVLLSACFVHAAPKPPKSMRLYVFDCGTLHITNVDGYSLKKEEVASIEMAVPCFLVVHPKGTLMWDNGNIPDGAFKGGSGPVTVGLTSQNAPLLPQLAAVGYTPADIKYLAMSHYHGDHVANANAFAGSTWLARKVERDRMFSDVPIPRSDPANYRLLKDSKTIILDKPEYDVFGDGKVILKLTPGHTPGHQVMYLKLAKTGPIVLSGDLYHYPEERTLNRLPPGDFNKDQTAASRADLEIFLKKTHAQLWIQHDFQGNAKLKKSPAFYD